MKLRPYQIDLLDRCRAEYGKGRRAVLMTMATGGGKSACMASAANGVARKGNSCGIIAHRQELILQMSLTLARQEIFHGMIAPDGVVREAIKTQLHECGRSFYNSESPIKVCSVQTLVRREHEPFKFLFIDEAHHATAGSWAKVIEKNNNPFILGVTATPERLDGKGLGASSGGCFDVMVEGPDAATLMADGFLTTADVYGSPHQLDFSEVHTRKDGDFDLAEAANVVNKPSITGCAVSHYRRLAHGQPAIAFCINIEHAQDVAAEFRAAGYRAQCVDGTMGDADRRAAIRALGEGRLDVLTSCEIINEGTDVPVVTVAILLRPTQSLGLHLQQIGRVLRPVFAPGFPLDTREGRLQAIAMSNKPRAIILDHVGNCAKHGFAEDVREWSLGGRPKRSKRDAPALPATRTCVNPECFAEFRASIPACPACGTAAELTRREIEYREGELVKIERAAAEEARRREYWEQRRAQADAKGEEDLVRVFMAQGMGYGAAITKARYVLNARRAKAGAVEPKLI
jgi:superfamily II DNA or RNA helicase